MKPVCGRGAAGMLLEDPVEDDFAVESRVEGDGQDLLFPAAGITQEPAGFFNPEAVEIVPEAPVHPGVENSGHGAGSDPQLFGHLRQRELRFEVETVVLHQRHEQPLDPFGLLFRQSGFKVFAAGFAVSRVGPSRRGAAQAEQEDGHGHPEMDRKIQPQPKPDREQPGRGRRPIGQDQRPQPGRPAGTRRRLSFRDPPWRAGWPSGPGRHKPGRTGPG